MAHGPVLIPGTVKNAAKLVVFTAAGLVIGLAAGRLALGPLALLMHVTHHQQDLAGLVGAGVGAAAGWVRWTRRQASAAPSTVHGSASFAPPDQVRRSMAVDKGLIVGRENRNAGKLLRYAGDAHLITIAPTRSGKGVGAIIPNLLTADRSILCIDPKGENARITSKTRAKFGPVYVLDPFEASGEPTSAFNPLDQLDPESLDLAEDAGLIADAMVYDPPGQTGDAHWNEEAKALITGLILYTVCETPSYQRNLATVRDCLTRSPEDFQKLLQAMQASSAAKGLIRRAANRHLGKSDREASGVLSSAQRHTHFLDSPRIAGVTARSDFRFEDLKASSATVFLVLPPDRLDANARWLRLMVSQGLQGLSRAPSRPSHPVLFLLDEFAALGRLEALERAFGLMAGYGIQLWPILQDLHQLKSTYGQSAGTFLSNAGVVQVFNVSDLETARWVSSSLGSYTVSYQIDGSGSSTNLMQPFKTNSTSATAHLAKRELLTPDEVMRLGPDLAILMRQGGTPVLARKVRYFADPEF